MPPQQNPFWDFVQSINNLNPNNPRRDPGYGVDHHSSPPFHPMPGGFPFGGPPPHGHPPHPPPSHGPWGPPPLDWASWFNNFNGHDVGEGPWAGRGGPHGPPRYDDVNSGNAQHAQPGAAAAGTERGGRSMNEKDAGAASPETMQEGEQFPDPAEVTPSESDDDDHGGAPPPSYPTEDPSGRRGRRGHAHSRGGHSHAHSHGRGRCGGRRGGWRRGGGPFGGGPGPNPGPGGPPFDFPGMMRGFVAHPFFRNLRDQAERYYHPAEAAGGNARDSQQSDGADDNAFAPPIDIFNTPDAFILHTALPGAKKDDIGVTWNPQSRTLRIAGVVHRPGDEAFLQTLTSVRERRVGVFEREVRLPPEGDDASGKKSDGADADLDVDVDGFGITARMEEGVLIVTVPKVEKEWMEVRKVDIE
ncbi:hsp20-like chaperone [Trichoderma arundinaceum]|uniref:Hsp20-like chaperone n=1 Tax=Trichoderma arundinaceum TaxID=490622 RepID=A0A395NSM5_TRIAR|nr:hsp20-like chaperone [Trichoderma arundinaceum]